MDDSEGAALSEAPLEEDEGEALEEGAMVAVSGAEVKGDGEAEGVELRDALGLALTNGVPEALPAGELDCAALREAAKEGVGAALPVLENRGEGDSEGALLGETPGVPLAYGVAEALPVDDSRALPAGELESAALREALEEGAREALSGAEVKGDGEAEALPVGEEKGDAEAEDLVLGEAPGVALEKGVAKALPVGELEGGGEAEGAAPEVPSADGEAEGAALREALAVALAEEEGEEEAEAEAPSSCSCSCRSSSSSSVRAGISPSANCQRGPGYESGSALAAGVVARIDTKLASSM